jgi:hypothetical protein
MYQPQLPSTIEAIHSLSDELMQAPALPRNGISESLHMTKTGISAGT